VSIVLASNAGGCTVNQFLCAVPNAVGNVVQGAQNVANGVAQTANFWSDPWGNTFYTLQGAAKGLADTVMPALSSAALPDLNAQWFLNVYAVSFALAIFAAVVILFPQFVRTARGLQSGRELTDSVGIYFPLFLIGAMFGPALGIVLVNFVGSLTNVLIHWGIASSTEQVASQFQTMITDADPTGIAGGAPVAAFLMLCMLIGLGMVVLMLIVMLVTLYFSGVLIPLSLVWIIDPGRRQFGMKLTSLWIGILLSHPLLFLVLGAAYDMAAASVSAFGNNAGLQSLVSLVVSIISLLIAALSPLMLLKFAPVIPHGSATPQRTSTQVQPIGSPDLSDAGRRYRLPSSDPEAQSSSAPTLRTAAPAAEPEVPLGGTGLAGATARSGAGADAATIGAGTGASAGAGAGAAAGAGGAETLAATGAAESATGVGAAIGVPTLIAAAAAKTAQKGMQVTQAAGDQAASHMEDS
jgi:hypothetical protein